jgi:hypothetical protein
LKKKIIEKLSKLKLKILRFFSNKSDSSDLKEEISTLKIQMATLTQMVQEQSTIIVAVTKIQSDLCKSISSIENSPSSNDYFLIKIPLKNDEISN